jgi:hypothetical protein
MGPGGAAPVSMPSLPAKPEAGIDKRFGCAPIASGERYMLLAVGSALEVEGTKPFPHSAKLRSVLHKQIGSSTPRP